MNLFRRTTGLLLILMMILPVSCGKYDDGPLFSIYSKKERATGNWRFQLVREDGVDKTEDYASQTVNMLRNGDLYWAQGTFPNSWETYGIGGEWKFVNDKNQIEMHFFTGVNEPFSIVWDIQRLAYGDLRLIRHEDGKLVEWRMWKPY